MKVYRLVRKQVLPVDIESAWTFFSTPQNLQRITPDTLGFDIATALPERIHAGLFIGYRLRVPPGLRLEWWTEIKHVEAPHRFVDEQRAGSYRLWYHEHLLRAVDGGWR